MTLASSNKHVLLVLCDGGQGISEGDEEKIFEKFFRTAQAGQHGAGLGLAICKAIASLHGGCIRAKRRTAPAQGLCIEVEIPTQHPLLSSPSPTELLPALDEHSSFLSAKHEQEPV